MPEIDETYRLYVFFGTFVIFALLEHFLPKRSERRYTARRWFTNLALVMIDSLAVRFLLPLVAIGAAEWASSGQIGLFHWLSFPLGIAIPLSVFLLDGAIWFQHMITHKIPWLWRLHRVHHSDVDFDVTTGIRFHPIEILLSMLYKIAIVVLLGIPVWAVFIYEVILNAMAIFNHANLRLPLAADKILRAFLVTPDMHRVHHSVIREETDSNYGNFLSIWDRLFGTYIPEPQEGQEGMTIGLEGWQDEKPARLDWTILNPFFRR